MTQAQKPAGYVLLAVLLVTALIASLVMTYSRHALLAADSSSANTASQQAQSAADTGFAWAKQSLLADAGSATRLDLGDGRSVAVNVANGSTAALRTVGVDAMTTGTNQSLQATFEVYSLAGDELPELTAAAKSAVAGASPKTTLSGVNTYTSTELTGIILLRSGATLTLQDVVLDGAIVTEGALNGSNGRVTINLRGGVQINPGSVLPGCAIIAPNADVSGNGAERVELHGAVIAESLSLTGSGALHGEVACANPPTLGSSIDRPGAGRAPRAWPSSLVTNSAGVSRLAFSPADVREAEKTAIRGYSFPARRVIGGEPER